jgi:hypothetical protein
MVFSFSQKDTSWDILSSVSNYFYWAFIGNPEAFDFRRLIFMIIQEKKFFISFASLPDWHPQLKALFEYSDQKSLSVTPIRSSLPKAPWPSGNITALGDAVHTMSPQEV